MRKTQQFGFRVEGNIVNGKKHRIRIWVIIEISEAGVLTVPFMLTVFLRINTMNSFNKQIEVTA